ncbi:MAG: tetratricopeptide repeat protein [Fermentimonas caenicola]|nr:MAG: tetratricopeptide repeat protein [Fermentimonas caenicola]
MKRILYIIFICIIPFFFSACNNPQPKASIMLQKAEQLIDEYPDSALLLIDSIFYPEKSLNNEDYMRYLVRLVQAKKKTDNQISEDTLIFIARDFFTRKDKDPHITALSWYYSGCIFRENRELEDAMDYYKTAFTYAEKTGDVALQGLIIYNIGDLLVEQGLYKDALKKYKESAQLYCRNPEKLITCYGAQGRMFTLIEEYDSAIVYFQRGLDLADSVDNKTLQSVLAQNISIVYRTTKQYDKAIDYLNQSFNLNNDSSRILRYYLNLSRIYSDMGQSDSAYWYSAKLKNQVDNHRGDMKLQASIYQVLASVEKNNGNYDEAFKYQDKYTTAIEKITEERLEQSVYEVQRKYDYEIMRNHYIQRISTLQSWAIIMLIAIVIGGALFSWYTLKQKTEYLKTQQQIEILRGISAELKKSLESKTSARNQNMRQLLLWKFDVVKKSALLDQFSTSEMSASEMVKEFRKIVYNGKKDDHWQHILSVINEMNEGVFEKMELLFPNLTETEQKIAVLTYSEMSVRDISIILNLSPNTVQKYRSDLRKKLNIDDKTIDTATYLKGFLQAL